MNILVYQIGSLGDTLVTIPAYRAIRRHFGADAILTVLHNRPMDIRATPVDVLQATGLVDRFIAYDQAGGVANVIHRIFLAFRIWLRRFDAVIYLAPSKRDVKSINRDSTFFRTAGIKRLFGFHACSPVSTDREKTGPHEAMMRLDRLKQDGILSTTMDFQVPFFAVPHNEKQVVDEWLGAASYARDSSLVAICPGANQPAKLWSLDQFKELGLRILGKGNYSIVLLGGPQERIMADELIAAWGTGMNACGEFTVVGSAALLQQCKLHIGLDTGTTHLASIIGTPSVVLFAARSRKGLWTPLGKNHTLILHEVPCAGCELVTCTVPGHPCMASITVDEVWQEVKERL